MTKACVAGAINRVWLEHEEQKRGGSSQTWKCSMANVLHEGRLVLATEILGGGRAEADG
jgi:hypothetical protein